MTNELCPDCGAPLDYDEVDIGVGVQRGNYGCPDCGWAPDVEVSIDCGEPTYTNAEAVIDAVETYMETHPPEPKESEPDYDDRGEDE